MDEYKPDIVAVSETWLTPDVLNSEFFPEVYHVFRKDRSDGYGGVLLACRNTIARQELSFDHDTEAVICEITLNSQNLIICSIYRPPNKDICSVESLYDLFQT